MSDGESMEVKEPKAFLGDLAVEEVPVYLWALARAGRMIVGMAIYGNDQDRVRAMRVLVMAEEELHEAKKDIEREWVRLGLEE